MTSAGYNPTLTNSVTIKRRTFAGLFSSLFRDSDLVPSDLIAGCILLRVKQKRESREQWRLELMAEQRLNYKTGTGTTLSSVYELLVT